MMNEKVAKLLTDQVNKEFYSGYLYLAFANYYQQASLDGFAHWFEEQAREEWGHALKFFKYLQDNNVKFKLEAIAAPQADFTDFRQPLAAALKHEEYVTGLINAIYSQAREVDDYRCCQFLEWFIAEQGEEEKTVSDLLGKYDLLQGDPRGIYLMDAELKGRPSADVPNVE